MPRARLWPLIDLVVVATLAVTAVVQLWASTPAGLVGGPMVHTVLAASCTLPLLLRRRYAVAVLSPWWLLPGYSSSSVVASGSHSSP